ncbi:MULTISPECIES: NmrA family NAD(P)-binding protein [unclassified Acidisoma]|jgi:NAD(P)H dehydrogenase (quinone)|uniref:NmrA family NAD(P)-binding protein n=1 Tax=unclassified Acidisoma TaxID=2634065 RepID=UPI0020B16EA6|nr:MULTISPECIES: NmrA family NAD(P)-binding protein [unclassified Acidisoma]
MARIAGEPSQSSAHRTGSGAPQEMEKTMYAVMGITGQVGGAVARELLAQGKGVRAVVRDADKGRAWSEQGCKVSLAEISDVRALTAAFTEVEGVFVMIPSLFDPAEGFPEVRAISATLHAGLLAARPPRVVCLSTVGAQVTRPNLLSQLGIMEKALGDLPLPIAFLRAAWFMENSAWDVAPARDKGVVPSFLQPLDHAVPMIATADIGRVAAALLQEDWTGRRVVELEASRRYAAQDIAAAFTKILGRPIRMELVPRDGWETLFRSQGAENPMPRIQMLDGFNEGWIAFEGGAAESRKGETALETVLRELVERG